MKYVFISLTVVLLCISYLQHKQLRYTKTKITELTQVRDSLQKDVDSLSQELYPVEIELNRFETALQIFLRRNPKAAEQYSTIISEETE
jgi:hypothetical protein